MMLPGHSLSFCFPLNLHYFEAGTCGNKNSPEQFWAYIILTASEARENSLPSLPEHHIGP